MDRRCPSTGPCDCCSPASSPYGELNGEDLSQLDGYFNGIIQHSFALQLPLDREFHATSAWLQRRGRRAKSLASFSSRQPEYQREAHRRLSALFTDPTGAFTAKSAAQLYDEHGGKPADGEPAAYSWLVGQGHTSLDPQPLEILRRERYKSLPAPLAWAGMSPGGVPRPLWDGFVFALRGAPSLSGGEESPTPNDLLFEQAHGELDDDDPREVTRVLFQLWAHWRSRLFGVSLAGRFFNVFLPHAILRPTERNEWQRPSGLVAGGRSEGGEWLLQPLLSFVRDPDGPDCRRTCTFTALFLPVEVTGDRRERTVARQLSLGEIEASVRGAWALAANHLGPNRTRFTLDGPLRDYCENVRHGLPKEKLTARQWIEATIFPIAQLKRDRLKRSWRRRRLPDDGELGDRVLTALASSRVSVVTTVDPHLRSEQVRRWHEVDCETGRGPLFPGSMIKQMRAVSGRTYLAAVPAYRVDRPFLDRDHYVECVVPAAKCLITTTTLDSQQIYDSSGLLQSVFSGYMALGAANAQSLIRSSYHEIEAHADPKEFGEISKEFTRDFHEIYDLDITWEAYKRTYRAILEQLEIIRDYEALRYKLDMLLDATVAEFAEWQHTRLWVASMLLVVVAIATIVVQIFVH